MRETRGGPGEFARRRARVERMDAPTAAVEALAFLHAVLRFHEARADLAEVADAATGIASNAAQNRLAHRYPLLDLDGSATAVEAGIGPAAVELADAAPAPLADAGVGLTTLPVHERVRLIEDWLVDPSLVDPRLGAWIRVAAAPVLEGAAVRSEAPAKEEWSGRACPMCGDAPQCSAIVEESAAFLQGAPRYLICARCSTWWGFARAVCACCGEDDSRRVFSFVDTDHPWVRIDGCDTCHGYIKSFDLREKGALEVVPLVDDVATLAMDVWAHERGLSRPALSLAGV